MGTRPRSVGTGLIVLLFLLLSGPVPPTSADARPAHGGSKGRAEKTRKGDGARAVKKRVKPVREVPDDPSIPLGTAWKGKVGGYLASVRPEYGSFVAIDVSDGVLLALSEFTSNKTRIPHPATAATFPAASIFKIVTAAALVENTGVKKDTVACIHGGSSELTEEHIRDTPRLDRTCRSLGAAFARSTNAVFGKLAVKHLDGESLLRFAERLGFNRTVRVGEVEATSRATPPSQHLGLARMAAGFANAWLTPLHGAVIGAVIARGGVLPSGVTMTVPGQQGAKSAADREPPRVMSQGTAAALRGMMVDAAVWGTGRKYLSGLAAKGVQVAVKTGTLTSRDGSGLFNTWMVGFFPAGKPEVAFAAHIATRGAGPVKAGSLVRFAVESYIKLKKARAGQS